MKDAMQNADYLKVLKDPAVAADPANAKLYEFFKNGASNDSLNDTSWLHTANPVLTRPITEGFAQSIDAVMLTAAVLTGIAFLISFALPNKKLTDPKAAAREQAPRPPPTRRTRTSRQAVFGLPAVLSPADRAPRTARRRSLLRSDASRVP